MKKISLVAIKMFMAISAGYALVVCVAPPPVPSWLIGFGGSQFGLSGATQGTVNSGRWDIIFQNRRLVGVPDCAWGNSGSSTGTFPPDGGGGGHNCWCRRIRGYDAPHNTSQAFPMPNGPWVFAGEFPDETDCMNHCGLNCANHFLGASPQAFMFRNAIIAP